MEDYFQSIYSEVLRSYELANQARAKGFDPEDHVEVPLTKNMSERVVGLVGVVAPMIKEAGSKIVDRIKELEDNYGVQDWRVALTTAIEVAEQKFCTFATKEQGMEMGIRIGIAYVTNGVVSSPLEGFVKLEVRRRKDGGNYVALFFSGPIRSAGGTGASLSVLIGDYVRKQLGYGVYDPTEEEIKRMVTELYDYHDKVTNLQYLPSEEEIQFMVSSLPVQIEGDPSEKYDVSNYKGLDRVNTDKIRNGPCLVIGEGLCQKSPKLHGQLSKWGKDMGLEQWSFLEQFIKIQKEIKAKSGSSKLATDGAKIKPDFTYIKDIVAGRPVLAHPLASGGLRIRYGRGRTSGFSTDSIHPATMAMLRNYIAIGTQFKVERPGKSTVLSSCDSLEGPIVKLLNGDVLFLDSFEDAKKIAKDVAEILYLGDVLINFGDFLNRKSLLVPPGYCEEWWVQELTRASQQKKTTLPSERMEQLQKDFFYTKPTAKEAVQLSLETGVPLHPRYTYHWLSITKEHLEQLVNKLQKSTSQDGKIIIPLLEQDIRESGVKRALELLGVPHKYVAKEYLVIEGDWAYALQKSLEGAHFDGATVLQMLNPQLLIRDKDGTSLGCRMGRPEKAKMRKLTGSPQVLFPVGVEGGRMRCFKSALDKKKITSEFPLMQCLQCNKETVYRVCETCHTKTKQMYSCPQCGVTEKYPCHDRTTSYTQRPLDILPLFQQALKQSGLSSPPELIKGVKGTSNKDHTPEQLIKGILRAKHGLYVNKDGTIRYDMTEMPLTHFKPKEIGTSLERLKQLGYLKDIHDKDLVSDDQILELKPQDIILPHSDESLDEGSQDVLFRVAEFIDDLLTHLYGLQPFYNLKKKEDLTGHLVVGLAPHISAGMVGRIIGFSKTQGFLAHPTYHSALRRDCFSRDTFLPLCIDNVWRNVRIGDYVDSLRPSLVVDSFGTLAKKVKDISTLGYNPATQKMEVVPVQEFTKHTPLPMITITTEDGRSLKVTENHKFLIQRDTFSFKVSASCLRVGDKLLTPLAYPTSSFDTFIISLEDYYKQKKTVMLRGINDTICKLLKKIHQPFTQLFSLSQKALRQYLSRNSFPLSFVSSLLYFTGQTFADLPAERTIGIARDALSLPSRIPLDPDVLWVIGLYVAEGFSRKNYGNKGYFQVDFAASEEEIRQKIWRTMKTYFSLEPSLINKDRLTYSSHILYDFFVHILRAGKRAYSKRIPEVILNLPCDRLRYFLQGYFDGDGSDSFGNLRVHCDSVSVPLINDLEFALRKYGIFTKRKSYTKQPGPKVKSFYLRKKRQIPLFTCHRLIIPSDFCAKFSTSIGFSLFRKQQILDTLLITVNPTGMRIAKDSSFAYPTITSLHSSPPETSYCLNVKYHFVVANGLMTYNCDGDEACIFLMVDMLLNFSRRYLPTHRGSTQDAPLVLSSKLIPKEVDDMVFDLDVAWSYPLELYQNALECKEPFTVKIPKMGDYLGTPRQYEGFGFTHPTSDINYGVRCSAYKSLPTMEEKVFGQMDLAEKIRAVDQTDVARLVIERHFIRDLKGNLRKFSSQQFRCVDCNMKYRRPPLAGHCLKCQGKILFTISEGSIVKYLEISLRLAHQYNVSPYLIQNLELTQMRIESIFGREADKQEGLVKWFG